MLLEFPYVLNVVSDEANALAGPLRAISAERGGAVGDVFWLSPDRAFDLSFVDSPVAVLAGAKAATKNAAADINVISATGRRKKLLIADMESTIIDCECLDELAEHAGCRAEIAAITERAMRGEISFEPALRERVALLKDLPVETLERVYRDRVRFNSGAREVVATMRAQGAFTILVSGGFGFFAERVAADCGFNEWRANSLAIEDGKLTGEAIEPILGRDAKPEALKEVAAQRHIALSDTLAIGDGANDLAMVEQAGLGVAYRAKPVLANAADANVSDLRSVLYLQGYRDDEIVG